MMDPQEGSVTRPEMPVIEPAAIKVFGIIHIVFAGLGVLMAIFSFVSLLMQEALARFMNVTTPTAGAADEEVVQKVQELMATMQKDLMLPTIVSILFTMILAVLLLLAGIALVRKRKKAVSISNLYAMASIAFKVIGVVLFFTITKAAQERFYESYTAFLEEAGSPGAAGLTNAMNVTGAVTGILTPVLMMIYPIIALVMLNRPSVREFLAQYGK